MRRFGAVAGAGISGALTATGFAATAKPEPKERAVLGTPAAPSGTAATWVARSMPAATSGTVLHAPSSYSGSGGAKHSTMLHCPANGRMYVFGGDYSGYCSEADKANHASSDDFRNGCFSYDAKADSWRLEYGWDMGDGKVQPWRPDWGHFCWDSKRKVFWHRVGGSSGAYLGTGSFAYRKAASSGLSFAYGGGEKLIGGRLYPDKTVVPPGTLVLPDDSTCYVEYDPAAHSLGLNVTGFSGGAVIPCYVVTTARGRIVAAENKRPYWMTYGDPLDNIDPRHYANPEHLLTLDPLARDLAWIAHPELGSAEDQMPEATVHLPDGRRLSSTYLNMSMVYDEAGDQLIGFGNDYSWHFAIGQNKWSRYRIPGAQIDLEFARPWFNPDDRKIYVIETASFKDPTQAYGWTYDVQTHIFDNVLEITPHQLGPSLWPASGHPAGKMVGWRGEPGSPLMHDAENEILWMVEVENAYLNPYAYGASGLVMGIHAWHYKENRHERIVPLSDPGNPPHGLVWGYDPVNRLILGYGQNHGPTDRKSVHYPQANPVIGHGDLYVWKPSGFTKG